MTLQHSGGPITGDMNGPEVYATIFAVGPGKRNIDVIWAGSDDGLVHVTRDGGNSWTNVTPPDMPEFGRVSQIDASSFNDGAAYVSVRKPLLDDFRPYIWKTDDFGATWTKIVDGIRDDAYVHAVREDPNREGLVYAGTQHGVYISYNGGDWWQELNPNLPDVPIADLIVEGNELVIGTHGRSFWVLDNVTPLRQLTADLAETDAKMFTPPPGTRSGTGLTLSWWLAEAPDYATLEIVNAAGEVVRTFEADTVTPDPDAAPDPAARYRSGPSVPLKAGITHLTWDLRGDGFDVFPGMILWGVRVNAPAAPPGVYTARLTAHHGSGETVVTAPITVQRNPWITDVTDEHLVAQYEFSSMVRDKVNEANGAVIGIRHVKSQLEDRYAESDDGALRSAGDRLNANASEVEANIYQVRNQSGQDPLNFPIKVNNRLANLMSMAERGDGPPGNQMPEIFQILSDELRGYTDRLQEVWATDLAAVNRELERLGLEPITLCEPGATCPIT